MSDPFVMSSLCHLAGQPPAEQDSTYFLHFFFTTSNQGKLPDCVVSKEHLEKPICFNFYGKSSQRFSIPFLFANWNASVQIRIAFATFFLLTLRFVPRVLCCFVSRFSTSQFQLSARLFIQITIFNVNLEMCYRIFKLKPV